MSGLKKRAGISWWGGMKQWAVKTCGSTGKSLRGDPIVMERGRGLVEVW